MRRASVAIVCCTVLGPSALAADLGLPLPPLPDVIEAPKFDEVASGWYLRGDLAYRVNHVGSIGASATPDPNAHRVSPSAGVGLGLGFKSGWFRTDATLDFGLPAKVWADTAALPVEHTVRIESLTGLINGYVDLGTWSGLTPYVGAGLGASYLRTTEFATVTNTPAVSSAVGGRWNFSWAVMAGVSYGIGRLAVDLGYRRLHLGTAVTATDMVGNQLTLHNVAADEFRLGLRLAL
jgi:opacity protein-like surface antigen